ncbi:MAG: hypothetical protein J3K34DRAFT_240499 [Monoraphidium minutum]|nr:MAG: hypothetical protein J3K34DRAFT_240499 [Monoraphidium minutum]
MFLPATQHVVQRIAPLRERGPGAAPPIGGGARAPPPLQAVAPQQRGFSEGGAAPGGRHIDPRRRRRRRGGAARGARVARGPRGGAARGAEAAARRAGPRARARGARQRRRRARVVAAVVGMSALCARAPRARALSLTPACIVLYPSYQAAGAARAGALGGAGPATNFRLPGMYPLLTTRAPRPAPLPPPSGAPACRRRLAAPFVLHAARTFTA